MITLSVSAKAQLDCYFEDHQVSSVVQNVGNALANCSVAPAEDYWMCRALTEKNCALVRGDREYWYCQAMTGKNCSLARNSADYWFCRGVTEKNCPIAGNEHYWNCRGITEKNCALVPANQYWSCVALGRTYH